MSRRLHYFLLLGWAIEVAAVAAGELLPGSLLQFRHLPSDKLLHFLGYFVAAALAPPALESKWRATFASFALILLGIALEFAQKYVPGRHFDVADMVANTFGVLLGLGVGFLLRFALLRITGQTGRRPVSHPVS